MPTFKNETEKPVYCEATVRESDGRARRMLIKIAPGKSMELSFWIPWQELGLTLESESYPPVPSTFLVSGTYDFSNGMTRKFDIEPCGAYTLNIIVQTGRVRLYLGGAGGSGEIAEDENEPFHYRAVLDWERAPYFRIEGMADNTRVTVHAEVHRGDMNANRIGDEATWR